jgi:hypothetical protein
MSVIYWKIVCAYILFYIDCFRARHLYTGQHRKATKMWQRCCWKQVPHSPQPATPLSHLCDRAMLPCVEVSHPKTINIKQYLSTDNFSVNNRNGCHQIFTNNTTSGEWWMSSKIKKKEYKTYRVWLALIM